MGSVLYPLGEPAFITVPADGSSGTVKACSDPPNSLELAVVLPDAVGQAVVVEDFEVTYTVGSEEYTAVTDVTYGLCASAPDEPSEEPAECRELGHEG